MRSGGWRWAGGTAGGGATLDMVGTGRGAEFGLLVHMFGGGFDEEDIVLGGSESVRIDAGLGAALGAMRDDVLYSFRR